MAPENMFAHALWLDRRASVECFVLLESLNARVSPLRAHLARDVAAEANRVFVGFCGVIQSPLTPTNL
jgi:hypothetical protein